MNFDTPLVEYLIIGMHTSTWIFLIYLKLLKLPLATLSKVDPAIVLLFLPFIYLIGMMFDDVTFRILRRRIANIKKKVFTDVGFDQKEKRSYEDERIAYKSEVLYNAYEARVRRVRIVGAAIFNMPLLGLSLALNIGFTSPLTLLLIIATVILTILSWHIWNGLNYRAYTFRKNAIDVIEDSYVSLNH